MNDIKVSIIIPVYKVPEEYLRNCIESCINQTLKNIEIILIDDGSPDNCGEICDEYALKDSRIKVIHKKNGGVSNARNYGILKSKGEYIGFVDADDWIEKDFYEEMILFGEKNKVDVVVSGFVKEKNNKIIECLVKEKSKIFNKIEALKVLLERKLYVWSPWDKIYKTAILKDNKIFFPKNISMGEDLDFIWRLFNKIDKIGYISLNRYHYCYRYGSSTVNISAKKKKDSVLVMESILNKCKFLNKEIFDRMKEVYLKEISSYCGLMLIENEIKYRNEIIFYQKKIRTLRKSLLRNKDFKLKIKLGILFFMLPNFICNKMKFIVKWNFHK